MMSGNSPKIRHILCGIDGSDPACRAAEHAAWLAVALNAKLTFLAVAAEGKSSAALDAYKHAEGLGDEPVPLMSADAEMCLATAHNSATALGKSDATRLVRIGKVAPTLLAVADEIGADTIVLGRHPHSDLRRSIIGSISQSISNNSRLKVFQIW